MLILNVATGYFYEHRLGLFTILCFSVGLQNVNWVFDMCFSAKCVLTSCNISREKGKVLVILRVPTIICWAIFLQVHRCGKF